MSKTFVLISCCAKKRESGNLAEVLYDSDGFKTRLAYARLLNPDGIYVISALHHVVSLTDYIEPYNVCLKEFSVAEKKEWARICWSQLDDFSDRKNDTYIILAGKDYYEELVKGFNHYEIPTKHLSQFKQTPWIKSKITCDLIHSFANSLRRFSYPFDKSKLLKNGVYFFFEKGEKYKDFDRIVRIGTHTGDNNLPARLEQHLNDENKDRSIFRKNIGRAILNKSNDSFLKQWEIDLTTKATKEKYLSSIDFEKLNYIEKQVSEYMRNNLSFSVFEVATEENRIEMEKLLIRTVSDEESFKPSADWLGNFSPIEKIRNSGLWLVNELSTSPKAKKTTPNTNAGKYTRLTESLKKEKTNSVTYSFEKINDLISPNSLPSSAYKYKQWWENSYSHSQAKAWLDTGFKFTKIIDGSVTFEK